MRSLKKTFGKLFPRYASIRFQPVDITVLAYLVVLGLLTVPFHRNVTGWAWYPVIHAVVVFLILEFLRAVSGSGNTVLQFLRAFYPAFGITFLWTELDRLVTMVFPYWANAFVIELDLKLFGTHPTVWVEQWFRPWLTELMNFFYAFYFLFIPIVGLVLFLKRKRQFLFDFMFLIMFTFCTAFLLFLLFPSEGAWIVLKDLHRVEPEGGFFLRLVHLIQSRGTIRGGAFPSSHVAAAFVIALATIRYERKLGWFLLPFAFGVALATVYCRYHHAVDAIAGMVYGVLCFAAGSRILARRKRTGES